MIDTRTVVTRGTGEQRKCLKVTSTGQTRGPGLLVALIMDLSKPKSRNICIAPVLTVMQGRLVSSIPHSIFPVSQLLVGLRTHEPLGIRTVSIGFSGESTRITVHRREIGLIKLWIRESAGTAGRLTYRAGNGFDSISES